MIPVLCDEWCLIIKYDDHDTAEAINLTEETTDAVVDGVRGHGKYHGDLGEVSNWTDHYH